MTDLAEPLPGVTPARVRHPARGYLLYLVAALLFAVNGTVSKTLLLGGIDATVLSQVRATAAFLILLGFVALTRPAALRLRRSELPLLLVYGVLGIALTQVLYFASIERLPIGITLLIEFTAPLVIAVWFRVAWRHETKPVVWVALITALARPRDRRAGVGGADARSAGRGVRGRRDARARRVLPLRRTSPCTARSHATRSA